MKWEKIDEMDESGREYLRCYMHAVIVMQILCDAKNKVLVSNSACCNVQNTLQKGITQKYMFDNDKDDI